MNLNEYLDIEKLASHIRDGVVDVRTHDTLPLVIYCYSKKATYDKIWDEVTTKTRGLIVDANTLEIVARPFEKFFNFSQLDEQVRENILRSDEMYGKPVFSEKLDGSMGTYWRYGGHHGIATKGSFHSEQAEWATKWIKDRWLNPFTGKAHVWPMGFTPVFEIIAQSVQHHVVHYLPHEDNRLVLIGIVNNETGAEMEPEQLHGWAAVNDLPVVDMWSDLSVYEAYLADRENKEGYIATWYRNGKPPLKAKIKHNTFLKLQKIAHHTTPKTVFQALREDDGLHSNLVDDALQYGSEYLKDAVRSWVKIYTDEAHRISKEAREVVKSSLITNTTRKEHAAYFLGTHPELASVCFAILDEKNTRPIIWDLVEPLVKTIKYDEVEGE